MTRMALLSYNRRLLWVVVPAVLWALLGMCAVVGGQARHGAAQAMPFGLGIGPAEGGMWVRGRVRRIIEEPGRLAITVEIPTDAREEIHGARGEVLAQPPPDVSVTFVRPGEMPEGPPEIRLLSGMQGPRRLGLDRFGLLTERYIVKFGRDFVHLAPRPRDFFEPGPAPGGEESLRDRLRNRLRERLEQHRGQRSMPPESPDERPRRFGRESGGDQPAWPPQQPPGR